MKTKAQDGRAQESELFDVDLSRLAYVVTLGQVERVADRTTGEAITTDEGAALWFAPVGVPGCRLVGGATGLAEVRLNIETHVEPRFDAYTALSLQGPVRLSGTTRGERQDRQGYLSMRCRGVAAYEGGTEQTAESEVRVPGVPVSLPTSSPLVVLAASEPRNVYSGQPVETMGQRIMRLQVSTLRTFTRKDAGEFARQESVMVDVPRGVWDQRPVPFLGRIELIDLRSDARVSENGRVAMTLSAAGYRAAEPTTSPSAAPAPFRRGRNEPVAVAAGDSGSEGGEAA